MSGRFHRLLGLLAFCTAACCAASAFIPTFAQNSPDSAPANEQKAAISPIQVREWARPERGWLYVLDPQPEAGEVIGRIWLLDPASGRVMGQIFTGADPDFALSPDGARLYVASKGRDRASNVALIDTLRGTVLKTVTIDSRVVADGLPSYSTMSVSDDGLALRFLAHDIETPKSDFVIDTIDTRTGNLLPETVDLGTCGYGRFIDDPSTGQFDFLCPITNRIRQVNFDPKTGKPDHEVVEFPWLRRLGIADAFLVDRGGSIAVVRGDGAVFKMNIDTAEFSRTSMRHEAPSLILPAAWPVSPDRTKIYLGYNVRADNRFYMNFERSVSFQRTEQAYTLHAVDTITWKGTGKTSDKLAPYWSAVLSPDGALLYALSPDRGGIAVFDTRTMRGVRDIRVGGAPALALAAP
jgi:DNA-binding beta-propeller fold protein YncE